MSRFFTLRRIGLSLVAATVFAVAGADVAQAGYPYSHCAKECILVPYKVAVIRYDHCGRPFKTWETRFREVCVYGGAAGIGY